MAHSRLLTISLLMLLVMSASASLYDRTRGMKTYNLPEEHVKEYLKAHDVNTIVGKHNQRESLKEHPDVKTFMAWQEQHKAGHPDAGVAFAGKIPHDFIPMMTRDHKHAEAEL